jgi:3-phenylpropionate/trans-cinnamate dioxygenase ferredoxin subunit
MTTWTRVSTLADFGDQRQLSCKVAELPLLLVRTGLSVIVLHDHCTHLGKSLLGGRVMAGQISCPYHGACFDLTTGAAVSGPAVSPLHMFPSRVEDGVVWADLTRSPANSSVAMMNRGCV